MTAHLLEAIVGVSEDYLGPAAKRFISRQISFHLNKKPEEIVPHDMPQLIEWLKTALALLTEDQAMLDEFEVQMANLTEQFS